MGYLTDKAVRAMGFKQVGRNVKISSKASIYDCERIEIGDNSRIDDFSMLSGTVSIGRNVLLTAYSNLAGGEPGIVMEDFSCLAYGCHVFAQSDDYSGATMTNSTVPKKYKREIKSAVRIGRHCIVGAGSIIFPGVTIAEGCSVGAMSLVTKSTDPWGIYAGQPARRLKERSRDLLALEQQYLAETAS